MDRSELDRTGPEKIWAHVMLCGLRIILVCSRFWGDVLYMWVITERLFLDPETTCLFWQPFTLPISNRLFIFKTLKNEITGMFLSFFPFKFELEMMETCLWSGVWDSDWIVSDLLSTLFFEHKPIKEDKIVKQRNFFFFFKALKWIRWMNLMSVTMFSLSGYMFELDRTVRK